MYDFVICKYDFYRSYMYMLHRSSVFKKGAYLSISSGKSFFYGCRAQGCHHHFLTEQEENDERDSNE